MKRRDLMIKCGHCDDLILNRYVGHGIVGCHCGRVAVDGNSDELRIMLSPSDDLDLCLEIADLEQKRAEIAILHGTVNLTDPIEKRIYYEIVLSYGVDDDIKRLDVGEIERLLPELNLPRRIRDMWIVYFGSEKGGEVKSKNYWNMTDAEKETMLTQGIKEEIARHHVAGRYTVHSDKNEVFIWHPDGRKEYIKPYDRKN